MLLFGVATPKATPVISLWRSPVGPEVRRRRAKYLSLRVALSTACMRPVPIALGLAPAETVLRLDALSSGVRGESGCVGKPEDARN